MITAVSREAWFKGLMDEKTEIPRVWRIIAVIPVEKEDVTPKLVEAVASKLDEVAGGNTAETEKTRPASGASPRRSPGHSDARAFRVLSISRETALIFHRRAPGPRIFR